MAKFKKGDLVRVHATEFDGEKERDDQNELWSTTWTKKHGEWCYGTISHVYARKGREVQNYRIKYDEGSSMCCLEGIIQFAPEGTASECSTEYSEDAERDALEEDILGDPEREEDLSGDEDPGTVEEEDTDDSDSVVRR